MNFKLIAVERSVQQKLKDAVREKSRAVRLSPSV